MTETNKESYNDEFRMSSVKLALESNQPYAQTARELGLNVHTLYNWIDRHRQTKSLDSKDLEDELKQLRKEVTKLKTERDILKKAAAYFATHTK